jgi:light-regulated signal transduction histidine kinase (bacteriophytochrome)
MTENGILASLPDEQSLQSRVEELGRQLQEAHSIIIALTTKGSNNSSLRFELLFEHSRNIILSVRTADGRIQDANAAALRVYGVPREEILSLHIRDLRDPVTQDLTSAQIARAIESNRSLEQLAFAASHDLQEPLRKIIHFSESVNDRLKSGLSPEEVDETAGFLKRMQAIIDGLLELSRVSTQGRAFDKLDFEQVAGEVLSDLEARIKRAGGQIEIGSLPAIEADPVQMHQLLQNLVGNALKFHHPDQPPVIQIRGQVEPAKAVESEACAVIEVADNGVGFDEDEAGEIFRPFQRLHSPGEFEGTGMGLAICQKIVERHHGRISFHSRPGEGTTFRIRLPLRQKEK